MSQRAWRAIKAWVEQASSRWPLRRRLLILLLAGQLALMLVLAGMAVWVITPPRERLTVLLPLVVLASLLIVAWPLAVALIVTRQQDRRIQMITSLVRQRSPGSPDLQDALNAGQQDELSLLAGELNRLFEVYHRSNEALARRANRLSMLNQLAAIINRSFDLQEILDVSLRETLQSVDWDRGAIYFWDERTGSLQMVSLVGLSADAVRAAFEVRPGEGTVGQAARTHQMIAVESLNEHPLYDPDTMSNLPVTQVCVPLVAVPGTLLGVLLVGNSRETTISEDALNLLSTVAHQIALAIDKAQLYQQVTHHAQELEQVVRVRTEELAQAVEDLSVALEKAQEAEKVKSLLLSTVSHELRTPLATIKGSTSMLLEHHRRLDPETLAEHLQDIEDEADKLTDLIGNLLEMSRIEAGILHIQRQPVNVTDLLESTISAARVRIKNHPLQFTAPPRLPMAYGDPRRIEQVIANLLDNAAKFSEADRPIEITARQEDTELIISVVDRGQGIPEEHLAHIFDRFYQIRQTSDSRLHGIGLGLAICRGLVEAHQGRIWVTSKLGEGSTFSFSLPMATPELLAQRGGS